MSMQQFGAAETQRIYKRSLIIVIISQIFGGAGLASGIYVGALFTFGSALAALLVGRYTQKNGRRLGLAFGFFTGALGAVGVIATTALHNIPLLFIALFVYGAGADLALPNKRATAVSMAMVSTTFGAVAGPNLVAPMGRFAESIGFPTLSGAVHVSGGRLCTSRARVVRVTAS